MRFQCCDFFLALLITMRKVQAHVTDMSFDMVEPGQSIIGKVGAVKTARKNIECSSMCLSDDACLGYHYQEKRKELGKCILIYSGSADNFQSTMGAVVYGKHLLMNIDASSSKNSSGPWKPPSNWSGPSAVLYNSLDNSVGFDLMEGTERASCVPLVAGKVNTAWNLNHTREQWVDLGIHTEVCMTRPETCGAAGGAISLWLNVIDCPGRSGIVSSYGGETGILIECYSDIIRSFVVVPDGYYEVSASRPAEWFHFVLNHSNHSEVDLTRMYINGTEVDSDNGKETASYSAGDSRIVVGRYYTNRNQQYTSVEVDELIFFNQSLTNTEVQSIYTSV